MIACPRRPATTRLTALADTEARKDKRPPKKLRIGLQSPALAAPGGLENRGVESAQTNGGVADEQRFSRPAHLDAATAHLLDLIRDFDAGGGWGNGFRSCAQWLSWRVGLDPSTARERVRVARALGALPGWPRRLESAKRHAGRALDL